MKTVHGVFIVLGVRLYVELGEYFVCVDYLQDYDERGRYHNEDDEVKYTNEISEVHVPTKILKETAD